MAVSDDGAELHETKATDDGEVARETTMKGPEVKIKQEQRTNTGTLLNER